MNNLHDCLSFGILQKFYSALRNIESFQTNNDIFENISLLDNFFSEFRNITFVAQKDFSNAGLLNKYEAIREKYLISDDMRWFVEKRNQTTKQKPFELIKQVIFDIYLPEDRLILVDDKFCYKYDECFDFTMDFIKNYLIKNIGLIEVFFSSRIIYTENGNNIEILPMIRNGINKMMLCVKEFYSISACTCDKCKDLLSKIESKQIIIIAKEMIFSCDYSFEQGNIKRANEYVELHTTDKQGNIIKMSEIRCPLSNSIWGDNLSVSALFQHFIIMHIIIFQQAKETFMPVFMVVYKDKTFQLKPFHAPSKSGFYRNVYHLVDNLNFNEISAIFYCGESYIYETNQFNYVNTTPYSERIKKAKNIVLSFANITEDGQEYEVFFDETKICDKKYVTDNIKKITPTVGAAINWLNPIIAEFKRQIKEKK